MITAGLIAVFICCVGDGVLVTLRRDERKETDRTLLQVAGLLLLYTIAGIETVFIVAIRIRSFALVVQDLGILVDMVAAHTTHGHAEHGAHQ